MALHNTDRDADAAAGIAFTTCGITATSRASVGGKRRQVVVQGRRVKTVDVHAHCVIPEAMALLGEKPPRDALVIVPQERLSAMDEQGIDVEALSINPSWYKCERDLAAQVVRINNEKLAALCGEYPDRFIAFASVALQYPDLASEQLEHAVKKLGLRGVMVGANVAGAEFSEARFHPFWAKAEALGVLVFLHPQTTPLITPRLKGNGWLANTIGCPLDTTIALSHLIFEGTLDRFPGLKICAAHGGGYLPSYVARSDHALHVAPAGACDSSIVLKKKPSEYLRQMYFDSLVFTAEALRHLVAEVGASQVVMGTDHPIPWQTAAVDHILQTPTLTDGERIAILGGTAARLLGIEATFGA